MKDKLYKAILKFLYKRRTPLWTLELLARIAAVLLILLLVVGLLKVPPVRANSWWLSGGIDPSKVIAAYQSIYAASSSDALVNLNNPGTNNATYQGSPSWNTNDGWSGFAPAVGINTGIIPQDGYTLIVRAIYADGDGETSIAGGGDYSGRAMWIYRVSDSAVHWNYGVIWNKYRTGDSFPNDSVFAITNNQGYINGSAYGASYTDDFSGSTTCQINLGNDACYAYSFKNGKILAAAIYNVALTASEIAAVSSAMAAINNWGTETPMASSTFTPSNTYTPSNTPTETNTPTITHTPTDTLTPSETYTPSHTPTDTATSTRTFTPTHTITETYTPTDTFTETNTFTPTNTATETFTPTQTFTFTPSNTPTDTNTPTFTFTPSNTRTLVPAEVLTATYDAAVGYYSGIAAEAYPTTIILSIICGVILLALITWGVITFLKRRN